MPLFRKSRLIATSDRNFLSLSLNKGVELAVTPEKTISRVTFGSETPFDFAANSNFVWYQLTVDLATCTLATTAEDGIFGPAHAFTTAVLSVSNISSVLFHLLYVPCSRIRFGSH